MTYRSIHSMLQRGLDQAPLEPLAVETRLPATHENVRGPAYYADAHIDAPITDATAPQLSLIPGVV